MRKVGVALVLSLVVFLAVASIASACPPIQYGGYGYYYYGGYGSPYYPASYYPSYPYPYYGGYYYPVTYYYQPPVYYYPPTPPPPPPGPFYTPVSWGYPGYPVYHW